ncbi:MAG TPA: hypothetical protein DCE42_22460 [Myxococcales bacterium]|nr:hypothetical protein [Deltaproteobacteria bacterium]HAA57546.1 hypothetical protein [Myxococcales bacterium]|tara:strand:+ start:2245 stop:2442 length:198 start_codon:yes stop_codon:yes gene_type:complete
MSETPKKSLTFQVSRKLAVAGLVATTALTIGAHGCATTNPIPQNNEQVSDASTTDEPVKEVTSGE